MCAHPTAGSTSTARPPCLYPTSSTERRSRARGQPIPPWPLDCRASRSMGLPSGPGRNAQMRRRFSLRTRILALLLPTGLILAALEIAARRAMPESAPSLGLVRDLVLREDPNTLDHLLPNL